MICPDCRGEGSRIGGWFCPGMRHDCTTCDGTGKVPGESVADDAARCRERLLAAAGYVDDPDVQAYARREYRPDDAELELIRDGVAAQLHGPGNVLVRCNGLGVLHVSVDVPMSPIERVAVARFLYHNRPAKAPNVYLITRQGGVMDVAEYAEAEYAEELGL